MGRKNTSNGYFLKQKAIGVSVGINKYAQRIMYELQTEFIGIYEITGVYDKLSLDKTVKLINRLEDVRDSLVIAANELLEIMNDESEG